VADVPDLLNAVGTQLRELARELFAEVSRKCGSQWKVVTFDVRVDPTGDSWNSRIRVVSEGGERKSITVTNALDGIVIRLVELRSTSPSFAWFGLLTTVSIDGECETQMNHDPSCYDDPTFFAD
jgi:hypothetical protein